jgi:FlaA1/EpsC-like NDP-sugar epimerase
MTIPEAARLVLQAAAIGESGQVLVLDMGEPVKIVDLARDLIRLSGHSDDEIAIEITGLRPGEKLFEEMLGSHETTEPTPFPVLRIARLRSDSVAIGDDLLRWAVSGLVIGDVEVRNWLKQIVPEFTFRERQQIGPMSVGSATDAKRN